MTSTATLGVDMEMIASMRCDILRSTAAAFEPDVVVVDKTPLGLQDELVPMLDELRQRGRARVVLGLRNVEDEPARVREALHCTVEHANLFDSIEWSTTTDVSWNRREM